MYVDAYDITFHDMLMQMYEPRWYQLMFTPIVSSLRRTTIPQCQDKNGRHDLQSDQVLLPIGPKFAFDANHSSPLPHCQDGLSPIITQMEFFRSSSSSKAQILTWDFDKHNMGFVGFSDATIFLICAVSTLHMPLDDLNHCIIEMITIFAIGTQP